MRTSASTADHLEKTRLIPLLSVRGDSELPYEWHASNEIANYEGYVYLFEFKVVELAPPGSALAQLQERDYAASYRGRGEPIHLIGVEFSRQTRNVTAFEVAAG